MRHKIQKVELFIGVIYSVSRQKKCKYYKM